MRGAFDREIALIGEDGFARLNGARVIVVGLGGVGGAAAECLARYGIGSLTLVDGDKFEASNLNRQILCTVRDVGRVKAEVAAERVKAINPDAQACAVGEFVTQSNAAGLLARGYDYCIDAIDDVKNKILLICECKKAGIPIVSAMGAGNRLDCDFCVTDIYKTSNDPFAKKLRRELKKAGVSSLDVVCARSKPLGSSNGVVGSVAAPPLVMGAMLAGYAAQRLIEKKHSK